LLTCHGKDSDFRLPLELANLIGLSTHDPLVELLEYGKTKYEQLPTWLTKKTCACMVFNGYSFVCWFVCRQYQINVDSVDNFLQVLPRVMVAITRKRRDDVECVYYAGATISPKLGTTLLRAISHPEWNQHGMNTLHPLSQLAISFVLGPHFHDEWRQSGFDGSAEQFITRLLLMALSDGERRKLYSSQRGFGIGKGTHSHIYAIYLRSCRSYMT
jgi:hypothetical protein